MRFGALIFNLDILPLTEAGEEMKVSALDGLENLFMLALGMKGEVFYLLNLYQPYQPLPLSHLYLKNL